MTELKPCPFCGDDLQSMNEGFGGRTVFCHPKSLRCFMTGFYIEADNRSGIERWNNRPRDKDLLDLAISLVQDELVTVGKGADIAGIPYYEFEDELKKRGIRWKG